MPKRKEPELTPAEQKKRFEALAREVGANQSADQFKKNLRRLAGATSKPTSRKK